MAESTDGLVPDSRGWFSKRRLAGGTNPNQRFEELFHKAKTARLPFDKECWLNIAFFLGEQYTEWADSLSTVRRIERPNESEHLPKPVSNKIQYFVLQEHANVLQNRPTVDVLPASEDPMAISNAAVAKAYLEWLADPQVMDWDATLSIAALWALAGTESFVKWVWNPRLKRPDAIACSPLDIYPDPYAREFKNARYVIHSQFMDVEQVYDIYGVEVKPTTIEHTDPVRIALMREMGMAPVLQGALVNELWYLPSRRHPDGIFTTWAGRDTLVPVSPFPYEHKQLPFTQIGSIVRPGTQHYTSAVSALRTPQMELNKFHAQMIQVREAFASPKWWIPDEMDLESDPDDSPRQILRGNSNGGLLEPKIIAPSTMPPNDAGAWIANEMMNVVGQHEVSQAQVPGRVEAAQAIEMLQEQDNGRLAELRNTVKRSISVGFYQCLRLVQQYGEADNLFTAYSPEGFPEAQRLYKTQLDPAMKIRVTQGTGLANSRAARNDQLMTMWQQQIIKDPEVMAELLDIPISSVSPDNMFDIRLARNENLKMAVGTAIMPNSWDNHDIHRREHNNYRKTAEYAKLDMDSKSKFEFHCQMHDQLQIQQLGKQLQIQSMAAAVAQGQGFQNPQSPGPTAPDTSGGQPGQAAPQQPSQAPPGAAAPPQAAGGGVVLDPITGKPVIPDAMGAQGSPPNPEAAKMTPQGMGHYIGIYAGHGS